MMKQFKKLTLTLALLMMAATGAWANWTGGTYTATADYTATTDEVISGSITVSEDVTLTISDGKTVEATKGIAVAEGKTLTIYGPGTLKVTGIPGGDGFNGDPGKTAIAGPGTVVIYSGNVIVNGGRGGSGAGGLQGSPGGMGAQAFSGSVTIYGGNVTATGGNGGEGSATITSEEKVTFANNKVTDTFYYCGDLVVNDSRQSYDLTLRRAVAMFRLVLDDNELPAGFAKMKFYYLGGSSTFSPRDGYGCVNSKQTEVRTVTAGTKTFDIYTMPHAEDDVLTKVTITALDANDNALKERTLENIPITRNKITSYKGSFFGSSGSLSDGTFRLTADAEWSDVNEYTF